GRRVCARGRGGLVPLALGRVPPRQTCGIQWLFGDGARRFAQRPRGAGVAAPQRPRLLAELAPVAARFGRLAGGAHLCFVLAPAPSAVCDSGTFGCGWRAISMAGPRRGRGTRRPPPARAVSPRVTPADP